MPAVADRAGRRARGRGRGGLSSSGPSPSGGRAALVHRRTRRDRPSAASAQEGALDLQAHRGGIGPTSGSTLARLELGISTLEPDVQVTRDQRAVRHARPAGAGVDVPRHGARDPGRPEARVRGRRRAHAHAGPGQDARLRLAAPAGVPDQRLVPGARIPRLTEVLDLVERCGATGPGGVGLDIETKVEAGAPEETAPREQFVDITTRLVREAGLADQVHVLVRRGARRPPDRRRQRRHLPSLERSDAGGAGRRRARAGRGGRGPRPPHHAPSPLRADGEDEVRCAERRCRSAGCASVGEALRPPRLQRDGPCARGWTPASRVLDRT